ncbi:hypothetical protein NC652_026434 [Populus alba x Populus x berolinensis]|nr:hypothetical protein NC652_026434 [Populus alba x Populus x berolinensis]
MTLKLASTITIAIVISYIISIRGLGQPQTMPSLPPSASQPALLQASHWAHC